MSYWISQKTFFILDYLASLAILQEEAVGDLSVRRRRDVMAKSDERPPAWIGHVLMSVADVSASKDFFLKIGLRDAAPREDVGILELRGGTHLILLPSVEPIPVGTKAPFDLMVDDVVEAHNRFAELGLDPTEIESGDFHKFFFVREPGGQDIVVNSSHATGLPV